MKNIRPLLMKYSLHKTFIKEGYTLQNVCRRGLYMEQKERGLVHKTSRLLQKSKLHVSWIKKKLPKKIRFFRNEVSSGFYRRL